MPNRVLKCSDLGLANVLDSSAQIDWSEAYGEDCEGWRVVFPTLTLGDIAEHAPDLLSKAQERKAEAKPYTAAPRDLADRFEQERAGDEWQQGFEPMMSFVWPVMVPTYNGLSAQEVADRIAEFAPTCSLIEFGEHSPHCSEEYGIALSGGGMNLSDQLAAAYLCANQVPPVGLLDQLAGVIDSYKLEQIGGPLKAAYAKAAEHLRRKADRVAEESARVFKPKA
jgi:hypothetical protein